MHLGHSMRTQLLPPGLEDDQVALGSGLEGCKFHVVSIPDPLERNGLIQIPLCLPNLPIQWSQTDLDLCLIAVHFA
jgi:hypothetical protein